MQLFLEAINRPVDAFKRHYNKLSWIFVIITILTVTVFDPFIHYFVNSADYPVSIDVFKMVWLSLAGGATYLTICAVFWIVCKAFGSQTFLTVYIRAWGISYVPTIICAVIVSLVETFFFIFWNNSIWGILLNVVLVGILIWKSVLYVLFLREIAKLKGGKLVGAFILCGLVILVLAFVNMSIGLKTPIL